MESSQGLEVVIFIHYDLLHPVYIHSSTIVKNMIIVAFNLDLDFWDFSSLQSSSASIDAGSYMKNPDSSQVIMFSNRLGFLLIIVRMSAHMFIHESFVRL